MENNVMLFGTRWSTERLLRKGKANLRLAELIEKLRYSSLSMLVALSLLVISDFLYAQTESGKIDGDICQTNGDCQSGRCAIGPQTERFCLAVSKSCSRPGTDGVQFDESYQFEGVVYHCIDGQGLVPQAQKEESEALAIERAVQMACPHVWENLHSKIDLKQHGMDLWEQRVQDRDDFILYMAEAMGEYAPDSEGLNVMASDPLTVATECATQRATLMQLMMEKVPNDIMMAMDAVGSGLGMMIGKPLGYSQDYPGRSCKEIKEQHPEAEDGRYWIDVSNVDDDGATEVFCEMSTDGGGWTMVAYIYSGNPTNVFTEKSGVYNLSRARVGNSFSLGILDELSDTEMLIALNSPDPVSAASENRLIQYYYDKNSPFFNTGPIPCTESRFQFRIDFSQEKRHEGYAGYCNDAAWYPQTREQVFPGAKHSYLAMMHRSWKGVYWGSGMGGNNRIFPGWIYVR